MIVMEAGGWYRHVDGISVYGYIDIQTNRQTDKETDTYTDKQIDI